VDTLAPNAGALAFDNLDDTGSDDSPDINQDGTFDLSLTGQEVGTTVEYQVSLNGGGFVTTTAAQSGLADGDYQFRAIVTDAAGNSTTGNVIEVTIDNTAPD